MRRRFPKRVKEETDVPFGLNLVPDAGGGDVGRLERRRFDAVRLALEGPAFLLRRRVSDAEALGACSNRVYLYRCLKRAERVRGGQRARAGLVNRGQRDLNAPGNPAATRPGTRQISAAPCQRRILVYIFECGINVYRVVIDPGEGWPPSHVAIDGPPWWPGGRVLSDRVVVPDSR